MKAIMILLLGIAIMQRVAQIYDSNMFRRWKENSKPSK